VFTKTTAPPSRRAILDSFHEFWKRHKSQEITEEVPDFTSDDLMNRRRITLINFGTVVVDFYNENDLNRIVYGMDMNSQWYEKFCDRRRKLL